MSDDRNYRAGTKEALFMLSRGYCYEPACKERVMRWTEVGWILKAEVTHIRGLNKGSARHDESMSVPERNNFKNLILLCIAHHKLVDGKKTWINYSVETLTKWKEDREGDLADELDLLDWINQEKLQGLMADAIEETLNKILGAIDNVSSISRETLDLLKDLVDQTLKLPYLDPEDIASLEYCAEVFELLPEHIPSLRESASDLKDVSEYFDILYQSAHKLENVVDEADALVYASRQLTSLGEHAPQLLEAAQIISGQSLWSWESGVRQINDAADKMQRTIASMVKLPLTAGTPGRYSQIPSATESPANRRRPWNYYWWGIFTSAVFVVIVLSLWTYVTAHK
jgi:hypothetical protein